MLAYAHAPHGRVQVRLHDVAVLRITPLDPHPSHLSKWRPWHRQPMFARHEEDEGWIPQALRDPREATAPHAA